MGDEEPRVFVLGVVRALLVVLQRDANVVSLALHDNQGMLLAHLGLGGPPDEEVGASPSCATVSDILFFGYLVNRVAVLT
jgi:hypothetical protein